MTETAQLDPQRQQQARRYAKISRRLTALDLALTGVYALLWLLTGASAALRGRLEGFTANPWLLVALFAALFGGLYYLIDLPLSYYTGFVLPRRFGQSNQTLSGWVADQIKNLLVGGALGLLVLETVYWVLRAYPDTWWLWAAELMLLFTLVMSIVAPVLLMPLFYKFTPLGEEYAALTERLERLFEQAGARVRGVYRFDMSRRTKSANAALTGLGATRRIILGDTLLAEFSADEIETVMAHELGHHVNRDIPLSITFQTLSTFLGLFLAAQALRWGVGRFGFNGPADPAALPLLMIALGLFGLVTMPAEAAFSRWRESLADRYALRATGNPRAFASAMTRIANQNLAEVDPEPWVVFLLYSHPPLAKRIAMAKEYERARWYERAR